MNIQLIAHTQLTQQFFDLAAYGFHDDDANQLASDGQVVAMSAIRTCYSPNKPSEIVALEGQKYFGRKATEGEGTEADRLIRHIMNSGHTSTMEHLTFTFAIEGVSRSLLAQLTRHRHFSYSVQSQRYVKFGSGDKANGFDYVWPKTIANQPQEVWDTYNYYMTQIQEMYDEMRSAGIPAEDARYILPNAATCNLVLTGNLRSILDFYSKRNPNTHAQWEIQELAEKMKNEVIDVEPWTKPFFETV